MIWEGLILCEGREVVELDLSLFWDFFERERELLVTLELNRVLFVVGNVEDDTSRDSKKQKNNYLECFFQTERRAQKLTHNTQHPHHKISS